MPKKSIKRNLAFGKLRPSGMFFIQYVLNSHTTQRRIQNHGTVIRTGITCKKISLQKPIEFGRASK